MFDRLTKLASSQSTFSNYSKYINDMEQAKKNWELCFKSIDNWRHLEVNYVNQLAQYVKGLTQKENECIIIAELKRIMQTVVESHKELLNKIEYDLVLVNLETSQRLIAQYKAIIENQKVINKEMLSQKENMDRILQKQQKLRKAQQQEKILRLFMQDSIECTMQKKIRRFNKLKEIQKEKEQYSLKMKELLQSYSILEVKSIQNLKQYNRIHQDSMHCRHETLLKFELHLSTFSRSLAEDLQSLSNQTNLLINKQSIIKTVQSQCSSQIYIQTDKNGHLDTMISLIEQKKLDDIQDYWKDKQIKGKIKRMIDSDGVNPEFTDQLTRFVQIIKKIMKNSHDSEAINCFKTFINKSYKFRLSFIFILQFYRINSKFEIQEQQTRGIYTLISESINIFNENNDSYALKQLMVLLMTYYVVNKNDKIYIIGFFKNHRVWRNMQLWDSILIQCVYSQKKSTMKMLMTSPQSSSKNDLLLAQKSSILNQILYVVKNMVIFDLSEKDIKAFVSKFAKMLNIEDKRVRDINNNVDEAMREQKINKQDQIIQEYQKTFFDVKGQQFTNMQSEYNGGIQVISKQQF